MEPFIGEIAMCGYNFAPVGWALCNGQMLDPEQNEALYTLIGTNFGGDGVSTFALPNLQGRVPIGQGQGPGLPAYNLAETGGSFSHTLIASEIPAHTHALGASANAATTSTPTNSRFAKTSGGSYAASPNVNMASGAVTSIGGGQAHENTGPYLAINMIIALEGIYPTRP